MKLELSPPVLMVAAGAVGVVVLSLWVWKRGISGAASDLASGAVKGGAAAVDGAVTGVVDVASDAVGLPGPDDTTTDPAVARWLIDHAGQLAASQWSSAVAYFRAQFLATGTGMPPPAGTKLARYAATLPAQAGYDESDRLLTRYPAPASTPVLFEQETPTYGWGA